MHLVRRRNFLAGLGLGAGAHLLGSMFRSMLPEALGAVATKKRLLIYGNSQSVPARWIPQAGPGGTIANLGFFTGLEPYKSDMLVLTKLNNPFDLGQHRNRSALSVVGKKGGIGDTTAVLAPTDLSIDRLIARRIGASDAHPSINLTPSPGPNPFYGWSSDGPGKVFPVEKDAWRAYQSIFGGFKPGGGADLEKHLAKNRSLLSFLREDIGRMNARLGSTERQKLDQYLDSIQGMETRLQALKDSPSSCTAAPAPPDMNLGSGNANADPKVNAAHHDIVVNALGCGITRVAVVAALYGKLPWLGDPGIGGHPEMQHNASNATGEGRFKKFVAHHSGIMAELLTRLRAFKEGSTSVGENTLLMHFNEAGTEHHANPKATRDMFLILVGNAGSSLKTGRHLSFPGRVISDGYISVANAMGVDITSFGMGSTGALPGLTTA